MQCPKCGKEGRNSVLVKNECLCPGCGYRINNDFLKADGNMIKTYEDIMEKVNNMFTEEGSHQDFLDKNKAFLRAKLEGDDDSRPCPICHDNMEFQYTVDISVELNDQVPSFKYNCPNGHTVYIEDWEALANMKPVREFPTDEDWGEYVDENGYG